MTGLTDRYEVVLDVKFGEGGVHGNLETPQAPSGDAQAPVAILDPAAGSIQASLEKQGIRLVRRAAPVETIVIDHIDKTPAEN